MVRCIVTFRSARPAAQKALDMVKNAALERQSSREQVVIRSYIE